MEITCNIYDTCTVLCTLVYTHRHIHTVWDIMIQSRYPAAGQDPKKVGDQHVCINIITAKETNIDIRLCLWFRSKCTMSYIASMHAFRQVDIPFSWMAFKAGQCHVSCAIHAWQ